MKKIYFFLFLICLCFRLYAQPKQEIRAVWLAVNYALDWPEKPFYNTQDIKKQEYELDQILDKFKKTNINVVFFQTRLRGDVVYPSNLEPRNEYVKRSHAVADYDPLAYAIDACHERGMECHAWFVVYPLGPEKTNKKNNRFLDAITNRSLVKSFKKDLYLDPGNPNTTEYLTAIIKEIVSSYDVDGIHFDYIRYPDGGEDFPDQDSYQRYGRMKKRDTWRRENINNFVYTAYDIIKSLKPWVQVSSSVVGMYTKIPGGSQKHWTAFQSVYQDPVDWLKKGKHDFIVPMMYYSGNLFFPFVLDWMSRSNGRFIVPGLGLYQLDYKEANWDADVLLKQIQYSRDNHVSGNAFFRARHLLDNKKGISEKLSSKFYTTPALLPPLTWLSNKIPAAPLSISAYKQQDILYLDWDKAAQARNQSIYYNLYRSETFPVDTGDPKNIVAVRIMNNHYEILLDNQEISGYYYVVTNYDRYHNESKCSHPVYFVTGNFEK
jgi:uncharacterized lipoprotein YddW (UPF0748 family)